MLRYWELACAFLLRASESFLRVSTSACFALVAGPSYLCLAWVFEILLMILLAGKIVDVASDPLGMKALKVVGKEAFDLCGTFHPFSKEAEADIVLGQCGLYDAVRKSSIKLGLQAVLFGLAINSWGFSKFHVLVTLLGMFFHVLSFYLQYCLMGVRKKQLQVVRQLARLEAWSFPLFDKMSQNFLHDAERLLITCMYEPGDHIVRQGERNTVMHLLVQGLVTMEDARELPKKVSLIKGLTRTASDLGQKISRFTRTSSMSNLARTPSFTKMSNLAQTPSFTAFSNSFSSRNLGATSGHVTAERADTLPTTDGAGNASFSLRKRRSISDSELDVAECGVELQPSAECERVGRPMSREESARSNRSRYIP